MKKIIVWLKHVVRKICDFIQTKSKKHEKVTENPWIRKYINETENNITFKIEKVYYIEVFSPKIMNLPRSTKSKIIKDENDDNVPNLEITEVILEH